MEIGAECPAREPFGRMMVTVAGRIDGRRLRWVGARATWTAGAAAWVAGAAAWEVGSCSAGDRGIAAWNAGTELAALWDPTGAPRLTMSRPTITARAIARTRRSMAMPSVDPLFNRLGDTEAGRRGREATYLKPGWPDRGRSGR